MPENQTSFSVQNGEYTQLYVFENCGPVSSAVAVVESDLWMYALSEKCLVGINCWEKCMIIVYKQTFEWFKYERDRTQSLAW